MGWDPQCGSVVGDPQCASVGGILGAGRWEEGGGPPCGSVGQRNFANLPGLDGEWMEMEMVVEMGMAMEMDMEMEMVMGMEMEMEIEVIMGMEMEMEMEIAMGMGMEMEMEPAKHQHVVEL